MKQNPSEDGLLRRYLLGELSQEERDELERRLLGDDDELFKLAEAVEADLLAAAARGELAPAEREQVLNRLASSPQGRERFAHARALNRAADEEHRKNIPVAQFPRRTRTWKPAAWTAMAASLLAAVIGLSTLRERGRHGDQPPVPPYDEVPSPGSPVQPPPPREQPVTPPVQPAPGPDRIVQPPEEERPGTKAIKPLGRAALQLVFLAGQRGEGEAETAHEQLHLTSDIRTVDLKLDVTDFGDLKSFRVALRNQEHNTIWEKSGLETRDVDGASALVLEVPATKLAAAGRYEVRIEGTNDSGEPEELPLAEFEVVTSENP